MTPFWGRVMRKEETAVCPNEIQCPNFKKQTAVSSFLPMNQNNMSSRTNQPSMYAKMGV